MDNKGFIKLHRKMTEWEWYDDIPTKVLFIHLLFKVNWESKQWHGEKIKRGELITSVNNLSKECNLTVKQVRRALRNLRETGEIELETTNKYTKIRIVNYTKYQEKGKQKISQNTDKQYSTEETKEQEGKQRANKGQTKGKQRATTKEYKNIRIKEEIYSKIQDAYNTTCTTLPKCLKLTATRKRSIDRIVNEYSVEEIEKAFTLVDSSDFLSGRSRKWRGCNFDWILKADNFIKIIEKTYNDKKGKVESHKYDFKDLEKKLAGANKRKE